MFSASLTFETSQNGVNRGKRLHRNPSSQNFAIFLGERMEIRQSPQTTPGLEVGSRAKILTLRSVSHPIWITIHQVRLLVGAIASDSSSPMPLSQDWFCGASRIMLGI